MNGKLIIISAPSGAGKTTIVKHLLSANLNLEFSISACNRSKRSNEEDGKDYYFLSTGEFKKKIKTNEFVEWEEVYKGQFYGTLKSEVERIIRSGKNVIFEVDVTGGLRIKQFYGDEALAIFIKPPSEKVLIERLQNRATENKLSLKRRIEKGRYELTFVDSFDKVIINDDLQEAVKETINTIKDFINQKEENHANS